MSNLGNRYYARRKVLGELTDVYHVPDKRYKNPLAKPLSKDEFKELKIYLAGKHLVLTNPEVLDSNKEEA